MDYNEEDVVWIKISRYPWWPAEVTKKPDESTNGVPVRFFNEDCVELITSSSKIKPFLCPEKDAFISKGLHLKDKNKKELFDDALDMALVAAGNLKKIVTDFRHGRKRLEKEKIPTTNQYEENGIDEDEKYRIHENKLTPNKKGDGYGNVSHCSSPSSSPYQMFKAAKLKEEVNWNISGEEKGTAIEIKTNITQENKGEVDVERKNKQSNGANKNSGKNISKNNKSKKRKLTFDLDNCKKPKKIGKALKLPIVQEEELDLPILSRTSTPRFGPKKKSGFHSKLTIKKVFTKLSKKKEPVTKPKKGTGKSKNQPKQDVVIPSENAMTPKALKIDESFELPTPSISHTASLLNGSIDPFLDKNECDYSSDSDTELPEGLSPIVGGEQAIHEKDIVWIRWKKFPVWPAFVRKIYRKKRRIHKLSLEFIEGCYGMPKRIRVTYRAKAVVPFIDKQKHSFMEEGHCIADAETKSRFMNAVEKAECFLHQKALQSVNKLEFSFFNLSEDEDEVNSDTSEIIPYPGTDDDVMDSDKRLSAPDEDGIDVDSSFCDQSAINYNSQEPSAKEVERLRKMTAKQENLVNFIKSEEMKNYLLDIFYKRRKSDLHHKYFYGTAKEKNSLKFSGFGPIYNEEQEEEIVETTKDWLFKLPEQEIPDISYILDVWIPEAVVYALMKVKKYCRKKAWEQFRKGTRMTKEELERHHQSMLEFKGYSEEEKAELREKSQQRFDTYRYKHGLLS